jgi:hypothetical protein
MAGIDKAFVVMDISNSMRTIVALIGSDFWSGCVRLCEPRVFLHSWNQGQCHFEGVSMNARNSYVALGVIFFVSVAAIVLPAGATIRVVAAIPAAGSLCAALLQVVP